MTGVWEVAGSAGPVVTWSAGWVFGRLQSRRERSALRDVAGRDALTGLVNRAGLADAVGPMFARAGAWVGCLLVDLDGFKPVNDTYGHAVGDRVLVAAAAGLQSTAAPAGGIAVRLGGDEFAVLLPDLTAPEAAAGERVAALAGELVAVVGEPVDTGEVVVAVGCSVGTATTAAGGGSLAELLAAADMAMYAAKRAGGGVRHAPEFGGAARPRLAAPAEVAGWVPAPRRPADRLRDRRPGAAVGVRR